MATEIGVEYLMMTDKGKILDQTRGDSHKIDNMEMTLEGEVISIKTRVEMIAETDGDKTLGEISVVIREVEAPHQEELVTEDIIVQMQI